MMTSGRYGLVLREVGRLLAGGTVASLGAGQLLERFVADRDGEAFEALVSRHGPMVLGTCRRMLADPHDVDDAFQATFLVLARKAGSIQDADRLGPWLHGVARRIATRSRALSGRRKFVERPAADEPAAESPDLLEQSEIREALDDELSRLPEKYRAPLILCYLEGLTHDEAAEALRWPVGTVRSRLAGGRDRLRAALTRRGLAPSLAVPTILSRASIPPALLSTTIRVATTVGSTSAHVLTLAKGALIAMTWNKLKLIAALGLTAALTVGGAGIAAQQNGGGKAEAPATEPSKDQLPSEGPQVEDQSLTVRFLKLEMKEEVLKSRLNLAELEARQLEFEFETPGIDPRDAKDFMDAIDLRIKELESKLAATIEANKAKRAKYNPPPKPAAPDDRIKRLEKQIADQSALIRNLQGRGVQTPVLPAGNAAPASARSGDTPKVTTESQDPVDSAVLNLDTEPPLFAVFAKGWSRITMVDPTSKRKSTYRPPNEQIGGSAPINLGNDLFPLAVQAREIKQLAIFDRRPWRWTTLDLDGSVVSAQVSVGTGITVNGSRLIGYTLRGTKITKIVAFDVISREWVTQDLKEPVAGELTPGIYRDILACPVGRFFYAYSIPAKKWGTLELKHSITWEQSDKNNLMTGGKLVIPEEDAIHTFDIKTGEWTHIDLKDDK